MPLLYIKRYTRQLIRQHPDWLFVFGDNLARVGRGGQAAEARHEPNAVGIATKREPHMYPSAFLSDADFATWERSEEGAMLRLWDAISAGLVVVWPLGGIGTERARLAETAPRIAAAIDEFKTALEERSV